MVGILTSYIYLERSICLNIIVLLLIKVNWDMADIVHIGGSKIIKSTFEQILSFRIRLLLQLYYSKTRFWPCLDN